MKNLVVVVVFFATILNNAFAQKINNFKESSENHILVKGTDISLIPPIGFMESKSFSGFQDPNNSYSMIMVSEIPGPFLAVSAGFNKEMMQAKGMDLKSKKSVSVGDFNGYIISMDQKSGDLSYSKYILIYGDSSKTKIINGVYLADSVKLGNRILESIQTLFIDEKIVLNPRKELRYTIDEIDSNFDFKAVMVNMTMLNYKIPHTDLIAYLVDASFTQNTNTKDPKQFCIDRLAQYDKKYQLINELGINEVEIAGMKGYELYGQSLSKINERIFQTIIFDENGYYYIFCGIYPKSNDSLIAEFRKINNTFKLK